MRAPCLLFVASVLSCDVDLGPRVAPEPRTFGQIVYREACQRVTYSAELAERQAGRPRAIDASGASYRALCDGSGGPPAGAPPVAAALQQERRAIIDSVDLAVPEPLLQPLDRYLRALLPLQDDGTVAQVVERSGKLLRGLAQDGPAVAALSRLSWRDGFRPPRLHPGIARTLLSYPDLDAALGAVLPLLSSSAPGQTDARASAEIRALFAALAAELRHAQPVPDTRSPERTLAIALRFLLSSHPELRTLPPGQTWPAVLRDPRGLPLIDSRSGMPAPYVDQNRDGLADVDLTGHFVDARQQPLPAIAPFPPLDPEIKDRAAARDLQGRALVKAGDTAPLYRYIDLDPTALAALLRDGRDLLDPERDIPLPLLSGAGHLLGPRQEARRDYAGRQEPLRYSGFAGGPLLDLIHAYVQFLGYPDVDRLLQATQSLLRNNEAVVSRNLQAVLQVMDEAKQPTFKDAALPDSATLYDDLAPVLVRLLRTPGLVSDLVEALRDPAVADLGQLLAIKATDASYIFMSQTELDWTRAAATVGTPGKPVRRDLPDSDVDKNNGNPQNNRSVLQRVLHVVHDANGVAFCNKANSEPKILGITLPAPPEACSLYKIDDLALFYLLSIVGEDIRQRPGDFAPQSVRVADFFNTFSDSFLRDLLKFFGGLSEALLGSLIGIPGFDRYPHPAVAARLLFQEHDPRSSFLKGTIDPGSCTPRRPGTLCCNQGHAWSSHHDGVLFALERIHPRDAQGREKTGVTFFTAFRPIVRAFARHAECLRQDASGRCVQEGGSAGKILVDLLSVLHRHWPTVNSRFYGTQYEPQNQRAGVVKYEPLIAHYMTRTDLWPATLALAPVLSAWRVDGGAGAPALPVLAGFLRWFMDPEVTRLGGPLAYRNGAMTARRGDGQPAFRPGNDPVIRDVLDPALAGRVTPYYLLADAYRDKRARFAEDAALERRWKAAVSNLADLLLSSRPAPGYGFKNRRFRPLSLLLIDLLRERLAAHGRAGDLARWVRGDLSRDLTESLTGPVFAATTDLARRLAEDDAARRGLSRLLAYLHDESGRGFPAVVTGAADLLQLLLDDTDVVPVLRGLGPALDPGTGPDQGMADAALALFRRGRERDAEKVLLTLLKNLYQEGPSGAYPLYRLVDAAAEIDRQQPSQRRSDLSAEDVRAILSAAGAFLADQQRGLSRFLEIVRSRAL